MCTLPYLKWITNEDLLCSTGNSAQCCEPGCMGEEFRGVYAACTCMAESLYWSPETITALLINYTPVQLSHSVMSNSLQPHGLEHTRLPCASPAPRAYSNSCPSHWWCHPTISSSVIPFSSCLQFLPASGSFQMSQLFAWGGQSIGVSASASVLPMNIQDWFPLGWTGWISLQNPRDSQQSSPTPQFRSINSSALSFLYSPTLTSIHDY